MKNKALYEVLHEYEEDDYAISKFIGVFSSKEESEKAIDMLLNKPGFKKYPKDCFYTDEVELNKTMWEEGFCSISDYEEFRKKME